MTTQKLKIILVIILLSTTLAGLGQQVNARDVLISFADTVTNESGYKDLAGDIVIPLGKYSICFTDTFRTYAIVAIQKKIADKNVAHSNLMMASELPDNLRKYNFVFLDSVNRLGLSPEDLLHLKTDNPDQSFIFIFQTTKDGNFRGANSFQHDVDVVIEIPEKGIAIQNGRFNQGGEMKIFNIPNYEHHLS
jgi:hypothetical protein